MYRTENTSHVTNSINPDSSSIEIKRLDINLVRKLNIKDKKCIEQQLTPETSYPPLITYWKILMAESEKIGAEKILGYDCDKYQEKGNSKHIFWMTQGTDILLRNEEELDNFKRIKVAKELKFEKQDISLFEIPNDYEKVSLRLSTDEDLKKVPPLTPTLLEKLLFEGVETGLLVKENKIELLSKEKIQILKQSIINGTDLKDVTYDEIDEKHNNNLNPLVCLTTDGAPVLIYDITSGYLYVNKKDIYRKTEAEHYYDEKWKKKFLTDGFKIKSSEEIIHIIN